MILNGQKYKDESIVCMVCICAPSAGVESLCCTFYGLDSTFGL